MQLHAELVTISVEDFHCANRDERELYDTIMGVIDRAFQDGMKGKCYVCNGTDENHRYGCVMSDIVEVARVVGWIAPRKG